MSLAPLFGIVIYPTAGHPPEQLRLAKLADDNGLDLLTMPDHPYQGGFFDTWTLLAALALATKRLHFNANVTTLPLRLPSMLAKQAATLDILTGGRDEIKRAIRLSAQTTAGMASMTSQRRSSLRRRASSLRLRLATSPVSCTFTATSCTVRSSTWRSRLAFSLLISAFGLFQVLPRPVAPGQRKLMMPHDIEHVRVSMRQGLL